MCRERLATYSLEAPIILGMLSVATELHPCDDSVYITLMFGQALVISHRKSDFEYSVVMDHLDVLLNCIFELSQYALGLQSSPCRAACLLSESNELTDSSSVHRDVLQDLQREWSVILKMEASEAWSSMLSSVCPHTKWQIVRETFSALEQEQFQRSQKLLTFLTSWFPATGWSANIEDVFATLSDSIKRSSKADAGSLCNAQAVCIRGANRLCRGEGHPEAVLLKAADWEGSEIRGLKSSAWRPESCSGSFLAGFILFLGADGFRVYGVGLTYVIHAKFHSLDLDGCRN